MTASTIAFPAPRATSAYRVLGALGMLGSPVFLVQWLATGDAGAPVPSALGTVIGFLYLLGIACSATGLRLARATGRGRGAATIYAVQLAGLAFAAGQNVQDLIGRHPLGDGVYTMCDMGWPFTHVFLLVAGGAVLRARVWTRWRRWTPLIAGAALPVGLLGGAAFGRPFLMASFPMLTTLVFFALGLAVWSQPAAGA